MCACPPEVGHLIDIWKPSIEGFNCSTRTVQNSLNVADTHVSLTAGKKADLHVCSSTKQICHLVDQGDTVVVLQWRGEEGSSQMVLRMAWASGYDQ